MNDSKNDSKHVEWTNPKGKPNRAFQYTIWIIPKFYSKGLDPSLGFIPKSATGAGMKQTAILAVAAAVILAAAGTSGLAHAAPDTTDYAALYKVFFDRIAELTVDTNDTRGRIAAMQAQLERTPPDSTRHAILAGKVQESESELGKKLGDLKKLWREAENIRLLSIEAHKMDPGTRQLFLMAETHLAEKYLDEGSAGYAGKNPVQFVGIDSQTEEMVVVMDTAPESLGARPYDSVSGTIDDVRSSVTDGIPVKIKFGKLAPASCRDSPCNPMMGGMHVRKEPAAPGEGGSTLSFRAVHPAHGEGFVIAGHEAGAVGNQIAQNVGTNNIVGIVKEVTLMPCDCAFVKLTDTGRRIEDKIYAPDAGINYPMGAKLDASEQVEGDLVQISGSGSGTLIATLKSVPTNVGMLYVGATNGDSGAPVFQARPDGTASLYGMLTRLYGQDADMGFYAPWDTIQQYLDIRD